MPINANVKPPRGAQIVFVNLADGQRIRPMSQQTPLSARGGRAVSVQTDDGRVHQLSAELAGRSVGEVEMVLEDRLRNPRRSANSIVERTPKPRPVAAKPRPAPASVRTPAARSAAQPVVKPHALSFGAALTCATAPCEVGEHVQARAALVEMADRTAPCSAARGLTAVVAGLCSAETSQGSIAEGRALADNHPLLALAWVSALLDGGRAAVSSMPSRLQVSFGACKARLDGKSLFEHVRAADPAKVGAMHSALAGAAASSEAGRALGSLAKTVAGVHAMNEARGKRAAG